MMLVGFSAAVLRQDFGFLVRPYRRCRLVGRLPLQQPMLEALAGHRGNMVEDEPEGFAASDRHPVGQVEARQRAGRAYGQSSRIGRQVLPGRLEPAACARNHCMCGWVNAAWQMSRLFSIGMIASQASAVAPCSQV